MSETYEGPLDVDYSEDPDTNVVTVKVVIPQGTDKTWIDQKVRAALLGEENA